MASMTEGSLLTEFRFDCLKELRGCFYYKVHDAVRKALPDVHVAWRGFGSYVEAKYVRPGEESEAVIRESPAQLTQLCHLTYASGGRAFYAVWRRGADHQLWTEVWVPELVEGRPRVFLWKQRQHFGAFENGLFIERLKAQHSPEWRL